MAGAIQNALNDRAKEKAKLGEEFTPSKIYGSLTLDFASGGMNLKAVEKALMYDGFCKEIFLPCQDSALLQALFGESKSRPEQLMESRSYAHSRELLLIRTAVQEGDVAELERLWPPAGSRRRGSGREGGEVEGGRKRRPRHRRRHSRREKETES